MEEPGGSATPAPAADPAAVSSANTSAGDGAEVAPPGDASTAAQGSMNQQRQQVPISFRSLRGAKKVEVRRCGCDRREACHLCRRCVEQHCVCGPKSLRRMERLMCRESRPCDCLVVDESASRCEFCRGCRRSDSGSQSHCLCKEHHALYRELRAARDAGDNEQVDSLLRNGSCSCFLLFVPSKLRGEAELAAQKQRRQARDDRLVRIRRASGVPSTENLYSRKIALSSDSESGEDDDMSDYNELGSELASIVLPSLRKKFEGNALYRQGNTTAALGKNGCTLRESVEPTCLVHERVSAGGAHAVEEVERAFNNFFYLADQAPAWPTDDIVDYIAYIASVQVANIPELVGTMDDTAAVAVGIVVEEYVNQLVEEFIRRPDDEDADRYSTTRGDYDEVGDAYTICPLTEQSVKAFTSYVLSGFNWALFRKQRQDEDTSLLRDRLARQIFGSLSACRSRGASPMSGFDISQVKGWIRAAVLDNPGWKALFPADTSSNSTAEDNSNAQDENEENLYNTDMPFNKDFATRIAVRPSFGVPVYSMSADGWAVRGTHEVSVRVNNLPSKVAANDAMQKITDVMDKFREKVSKEQREWIYTRNYPIYVLTRKHINENMRKMKARLAAERDNTGEAARKQSEKAAEKKSAKAPAIKQPSLPPNSKPAEKQQKGRRRAVQEGMSAYLYLQQRERNHRLKFLARKAAERAKKPGSSGMNARSKSDNDKPGNEEARSIQPGNVAPNAATAAQQNNANPVVPKRGRGRPQKIRPDGNQNTESMGSKDQASSKVVGGTSVAQRGAKASSRADLVTTSHNHADGSQQRHRTSPHQVAKQKRPARTVSVSDSEDENAEAPSPKKRKTKVSASFQFPNRKLVGIAMSESDGETYGPHSVSRHRDPGKSH